MSNLADVFSGDAFSMLALTAAINNVDHVPGQAGGLTFRGESRGIETTEIVIESRDQNLSIIPFSGRGAPASVETPDKRKAIKIDVPHIQLEDTIYASSVQNVRAFGTAALQSAESVVNDRLTKMAARLDLTLEHKRLGALKGQILDADGSTVIDLFATFGVAEPTVVMLPEDGNTNTPLRARCQEISRRIHRAAKLLIPPEAQVHALCGDEFFDHLVSHADVARVYEGWSGAQAMLASNATKSAFEFGGIAWHNYRGTDAVDGDEESEGDLVGQVGIVSNEARFFLTGVPGLYAEYFAPGDFVETVNTIGLPRYAKLALDPEFQRWVKLHAQSNPLPICLRPQTLVRATFDSSSDE